MKKLIWDIETGPLPVEQLQKIYRPLEEKELPQDPGEFDPANVNHGNTTNKEKREAKTKLVREKHEKSRRELVAKRGSAESEHWDKFVDKAALSPVTGQVLAIGFYDPAKKKTVILGVKNESETTILAKFWNLFERLVDGGNLLIGLNIYDFDLPFLIGRSWILDVPVPGNVFRMKGRWIEWHKVFCDLRLLWNLGRKEGQTKSSFDHIGRAMGTGGKPDDGTTGADFARLWKEDRSKAIEYLKNDLLQPAEWAQRWGVI